MNGIDEDLEYQERWQYVKHSESVRSRAVRWYFLVVAALLTAAYTGQLDLEPLLARPVILLFLVGYSFAIVAFLVGHKLSYREHVDRLREIDGIETAHRDTGGGAFSFYLLSVGLAGGFVTFAATAEISRSLSAGEDPTPCGLVVGGLLGVLFVALVWGYNRSRLREADSEGGDE